MDSSRWLVMAGGVAAVGLVAWLLWPSAPPPSKPASAPPVVPSSAPPRKFPTGHGDADMSANSAKPAASAPQDPSEGPCGKDCACSAAQDPCGVRRACAPSPCGSDLTRRSWNMRLGGLKLNNMSEPDDEIKVCSRVSGEKNEACVSLKEIKAPRCPGGAKFAATTEQLVKPGVDIDIYDRQGQVIASTRGAGYKFLTGREACNGMRLGGSKFHGSQRVDLIWFYFDD